MAKRPIKPAVEQPNPSATTTSVSTSEDQQQQAQQQQQRGGAGGGSGSGGAGAGGGAGGQDVAPADVDTLSPTTPVSNKKRRALKQPAAASGAPTLAGPSTGAKRTRTNTPWTAAEEQRLKNMRDAGNSWSEIAKTFPTRTEGSVKKHWYKASLGDMHYAEFGEDEVSEAPTPISLEEINSAALLAAIKEYEANKWKVIGTKVGKPAKACEQYAKEHFAGK
ncbi:unnamed protein product [Tuber aestivum]|uniref:Myb-like domain-containing protein n=1 Tax=Tuber aestivum TaxID=59557 RepID=A0A292Q175_9PEZI|nr:unnamed protein product [Tuber aestivum]